MQSYCPPHSCAGVDWTVYSYHAKQLNSYLMKCLRKLHFKWHDRIPDTEVLCTANMVSINVMLKRSQLRLAGHVSCMFDQCLPKRLFCGELKADKPSHADKKKCYKDTLKVSPKSVASILIFGRNLPTLSLKWLPMKRVESTRPSRSTHSGRTEQATPLCPSHPRPYSVPMQ